MARKDFWLNVCRASRLTRPTHVADLPLHDPKAIERILRRSPFWLSPQTVDGFNVEDFDFLSAKERGDLADAVQRFQEIARPTPSEPQAQQEQIEQALPFFCRILEILRPDQYANDESLALGKRIEKDLEGQLPPFVRELRFETGVDWRGNPAVTVWVVFTEEPKNDEAFLVDAERIRPLLVETVHRKYRTYWPIVRFRTPSDLRRRRRKRKVKK